MRTLLVYLLAVAAIASGVAFGVPDLFGAGNDGGEDKGPAAGAPPVVLAGVVRAPLDETLEALGTVHANESVEITAKRTDHVAAVHFEDGQEVRAGDLLLELNAVEERAELAEANAMRDERRLAHQRVRELHERQIASPQDLDTHAAQLAAAEARVARLQAAINDHEVRAPFAGTLGFRRVSIGTLVQPATSITTLDDLSLVKLDFTIPETWVRAVQPGMKVRAHSAAWPDADFEGRIATVDTRLERSTRSATVRALLPNPQARLRPGMLLEVMIERDAAPVLQVPEAALVPLGEEQFVFRVGADGLAERVAVRIGHRRAGLVEIESGLAEGDRVVVEGIVRVRPGAPVQVVETR